MNPAKNASKATIKRTSNKSKATQLLIEDEKIRKKIERLRSGGYHYVAAPPGCGKTEILKKRLITKTKATINKAGSPAKAKELVKEMASRMLCVTFTRNAAIEMQNRVLESAESKNITEYLYDVTNSIRDFHSFALMKLSELQTTEVILAPEMNGVLLNKLLRERTITTLLTPNPKSDTKAKKSRRHKTFYFTDKQKELIYHFANLCLLLDKIAPDDEDFKNLIKDPSTISGERSAYSTLTPRLRALEKAIMRYIKAQKHSNGKGPGIWDYILSKYREVVADLEIVQKELIKSHKRKKGAIITSLIPYIANELYKRKKINFMDYEDVLILLYLELLEHPLKERYNWIEVDECQDTSLLQLLIIDEITDKEKCVVYFGDDEQNIFSSLTDTHLAMRFIASKVPERKRYYLRGNYRSDPELLKFINQYQKLYFPQGSGKTERRPFSVKKNAAADNGVTEAVQVVKTHNNRSQIKDMLAAAKNNTGSTAILFRKNEDVENLYNYVNNPHTWKIAGLRAEDVCIIGRNDSLFHWEEFRPIKAILYAVTGLFYERWWEDLPLHSAQPKKKFKAPDANWLLKNRISPVTLLDMNHRYSYLAEYSLALKSRWEMDLRDHGNRKDSLAPIIFYSFDYTQQEATLEKHHVVLKDKLGWRKRDLSKVRVDFVPSGKKMVIPFGDFKRLQQSILRFTGNCICMSVHVPHHATQMRTKYPDAYRILFCQKENRDESKLKEVWDIKRLYDELHRSRRESYTTVVAANVYNTVMHFDKDASSIELDSEYRTMSFDVCNPHLHNYHMNMVKTERYNTHRDAFSREYGEIYRKVYKLLETTDNAYSESDVCDLSNEEAGYLLVRAIKIIYNSIPDKVLDKHDNYAKGLLLHINSLIGERYEQDPLLKDNLYYQLYQFRQQLFSCTISKLISDRRITSGIFSMTVHKAKGLSFDHVIVADAVSGNYPLELSKSGRSTLLKPEREAKASVEDDYDEDIRLFYVAMTRAIHSIQFFYYKTVYKNGARFHCQRTPLLSHFRFKQNTDKK